MFVFIGITLALSYVAYRAFDSISILYFGGIASVIMPLWSYWFSDKTVLSMTGAKEAPRQEALELHRIVENLSITAGLPKPKVFIINDKSPNAFATGRNKHNAVVAVTSGLLEILDKKELEGVIAHELAHIGNNDMLVSTVSVVLIGLITLISDFFLRGAFFGGDSDDKKSSMIFLLLGLLMALCMPIVAQALRFTISRKREYLADATGAMLTRYPEGLASALEKIHAYGSKMRKANHATAHLFIANPFGFKKAKTFVNKMFSTHPPVDMRIAALRSMDKDIQL